MSDIVTLVKMQLKNQLELNYVGNNSLLIRKIVFLILRFVITLAFAYLLFWVSSYLKIFHNSPYLPTSVMTMILTIILILMIVATTNNLVNSLFMAPDNKLLITLPLAANKIFLSKIIIFYLFELGRNTTFTLPIFIAYGLLSPVNGFFYVWVIVAFIFISMIPVVIGMTLAIPTLIIRRLFVHLPIIKNTVYLLLLAGVIYIIIRIILIIPPSINVLYYWGPIKVLMTDLTKFFQANFKSVYYLVVMIVGKYNPNMHYTYLHREPWLAFAVLLLFILTLLGVTYFLVRFVFLKMISYDLSRQKHRPVGELEKRVHRPFIAFLLKEIKISSRTGEFTYNFLITYIGVPLFIMLVNQIFSSMNLYDDGKYFVQAFNLLLITLTYFASNSVLATFYAKEGRAGYLKKTKPINIIWALFAKLVPNIVLSLISLMVTLIIFNNYMHFATINIVYLALSLIFFQVGHILVCALFDLMNPQNELYATSGENPFNKNETQATILAFLMAFIYAGLSLLFLSQEKIPSHLQFNPAFLKLMMLGLAFLLIAIYLFKWMIKAYYYEEQVN